MTRHGSFRRPTALAHEIARHLRDAIVNGTPAPGERLNELKAMRELSSSRSPVREAIRMLEATGLVTVEPHRGARVRPVSETEPDRVAAGGDVPARRDPF